MLVQKEITSSSDGEDKPDRGGGRNGGEGFIVVTASTLRVAACGETGFVAYDDVVFVAFEFEHPFCFNWDGTCRHVCAFDDLPCLAIFQGVELRLDGLLPLGAVRTGGSLIEGNGTDWRGARVGYCAPYSMVVGEVGRGGEDWDVATSVGVPAASVGGPTAWAPDGGYLLRGSFAWSWEGGSCDHGGGAALPGFGKVGVVITGGALLVCGGERIVAGRVRAVVAGMGATTRAGAELVARGGCREREGDCPQAGGMVEAVRLG